MTIQYKQQVPLSLLTTFQNKGTVPHVYVVETVDELRLWLKNNREPFFVLGKGSNTVINPHGSISCVLQISPTIIPIEHHQSSLRVGAGVTVSKLMKYCQTFGLGGLDFCAGVPASVGGMVAMNFGCWGREFSEFVQRVYIMDEEGKDRWILGSELSFGYRTSRVHMESWVVLGVELALEESTPERVKEKIHYRIAERLEKQPLRAKTFGSIFKNPEGDFAARLIEQAGFKGKGVGDVVISGQHANFMVNQGDGEFDEVVDLISKIKAKVSEVNHIDLEPEVRLVT